MKRSSLIFEQEKERAKWNMEKDHITGKMNDHVDQLEKSERKKEFLMKDNERLKNDNKNKRNGMGQTYLGNSNMQHGWTGTGYHIYCSDESAVEVVGVTSGGDVGAVPAVGR